MYNFDLFPSDIFFKSCIFARKILMPYAYAVACLFSFSFRGRNVSLKCWFLETKTALLNIILIIRNTSFAFTFNTFIYILDQKTIFVLNLVSWSPYYHYSGIVLCHLYCVFAFIKLMGSTLTGTLLLLNEVAIFAQPHTNPLN